jgi:hypothetical protein
MLKSLRAIANRAFGREATPSLFMLIIYVELMTVIKNGV